MKKDNNNKKKVTLWLIMKGFYQYLTTKVEATEDDEYFDYEKNHLFTKEEITRSNEMSRKFCLVLMIICITLPFTFEFFEKFFLYIFFGIGTILFCIEILIKGSGIK